MESYLPLLKLLLPEFILDHFDLKSVEQQDQIFHLHLEEVNRQPAGLETHKLLSKGFFPTATIQDFPIRGHRVFLHIKRRRWLNLTTQQVVFKDWSLVAKGTRMTEEFAGPPVRTFLKEIHRY